MKNRVRTFIFISVCLLLSFVVRSQTVNTNPFEAAPLTLADELPGIGTYQFVLKIETDKPEITDAVLKQIEKSRDQNKITFIQLNENVKIKIHPINVIKAKDFKPFETYVYDEKELK